MSDPITPQEQIQTNEIVIRAYYAEVDKTKRKLTERERWVVQQLKDYNERLARKAQ